jgi:hypothetical protein
MAALTKEEIEFRVFEALAPLAGLNVVPGSILQPPPPAPDIYCEIAGAGPLAVELVAIDDDETRTRLNHMYNTKEAWRRALSKWPPREQAQVQANEPPRDSRRLHNLRGLEPWESQSSMHLRCESVR